MECRFHYYDIKARDAISILLLLSSRAMAMKLNMNNICVNTMAMYIITIDVLRNVPTSSMVVPIWQLTNASEFSRVIYGVTWEYGVIFSTIYHGISPYSNVSCIIMPIDSSHCMKIAVIVRLGQFGNSTSRTFHGS